MRVIEGENELQLTCSRSESGITLLRCETQDDMVRLPDEIDGVPVTEVGAYVLSERAPDLTGKDTFSVRVTCGGAEPKHNAATIRTVTLPKNAKSVGSYAFYNCRNLERIELTDSVSEFGGGALMNCMSLREVLLHAEPSAPTCLPKLLGEYAGELDVRFDEHARLLFPEYVEELEDLSPAHIFQRRIHGAGYSYRQCFDSGVLNFSSTIRRSANCSSGTIFRLRRVLQCGDWPYRLRSRTPQKRSIWRFCVPTAAHWRSPAPRQERPQA